MRIDKYLKVSRLIKRRSVACEACEGGRILVNGKTVKPSANVKIGDEIEIIFGNKSTKVKIEKIIETTKKEEAKDMFSYL